ncbi:hypothetical protein AB1Y20_014605 [Prymnesium parvum]|uniref:Mutator-like transposase domain-containing protein n=1 Tax=Prymnesium parvum TaxID=97485 RepID=A0AB34IEG8_PRYPA
MMVPHVEACARVSHSRALADERALALTAGELMDVRRRVPIPIAFDAQWMKPGKAMNAPDGYGVVIGGRTGKCIMSAYRTKVGELKNHSGSSGSMEPSMGAEVVVRLGSEPTEVYVKQLCMDLDSKTPKAVAEAVCAQRVQHPSLQIPQKLHDPNHFIKALRKRLMKVKKLLHTNNVLPPATQKQLGDEVAMAVHQHRGSRVGIDHLRAAIWNVLVTRSTSTANAVNSLHALARRMSTESSRESNPRTKMECGSMKQAGRSMQTTSSSC